MVLAAWASVWAEMSRTVAARVSQTCCCRCAACSEARRHSSRSELAMSARVPVQACRRSASRAARSVCMRAAACGASAAACTSRSISATVPAAWARFCSAISRAVCASVSQMRCCCCAASALACSHWARRAALTSASDRAQLSRRASSRSASCACRLACEDCSDASSASACPRNAAVASSSAWRCCPVSRRPASSWRVSASVQAWETPPAAASMRAETVSTRLAERSSKVCA